MREGPLAEETIQAVLGDRRQAAGDVLGAGDGDVNIRLGRGGRGCACECGRKEARGHEAIVAFGH